MKKIIKYTLILAIISIIIVIFSYKNGISTPTNEKGEEIIFVIAPGESVKQVSNNLFEKGLIGSKFHFETYIWRSKKQTEIQAGEYALSPKLTIKEISGIITEGRTIEKEISIQIIEGWTIKDIDEHFSSKGLFPGVKLSNLTKADFVKTNKDIANFDFMLSVKDDETLEGYLFPDTYRVFSDATINDVVMKQLLNLDAKLTKEMKSDILKQDRTIRQIITMASLIEKEVRTEEDMKLISGIFWNRIKNGQALQSCATLAFILGENKKQYTLEDTQVDSPYNTYRNPGLPPGPVSNPGLQAIKAAIYPTNTDYNYFLSRPDTGETVFSKTYDEHLRNKAKYLN